MNDIKKLLRDQAIARALGEIDAALQTFYSEDVEDYPDLYEALKQCQKIIQDNW